MTKLTVIHRTTYAYKQPITLGAHFLMIRPWDSHDLLLVSTALIIGPQAKVRWRHGAFGNSIAVAEFSDAATALQFHSTIEVELYTRPDMEITLEDYARTLPFSYAADETGDLGRTNERHFMDPGDHVPAWSRRIMAQCPTNETWDVLLAMTQTTRAEFTYESRTSGGVQGPVFTL